MSRAQPTEHVSAPPSGEVEWTFKHRLASFVEVCGLVRPARATVRARSWFAARDLAAAALGVGRDDVEVVR